MSGLPFCLHCLILLPYVIIWFCLSLLMTAEWLVRLFFPCWRRSFKHLFFTKFKRELAQQLTIPTTSHRLKIALFPSAVIRESSEHYEYIRQGTEYTNAILQEIKTCNAMLSQTRNERHDLQKKNPYDVEAYLQKVSQSHDLQEHLKALEKDVETITFYSHTQAVADLTGYRGFADWAEKISKTHEYLLVTVTQVAFVGAGLTYGAIFSSSRGDIGLMCYAFALFDCGFIVSTVALALIKWASQRPKEAIFSSSQFWTLLLNIFLYGSVAAIGVAICLLNISLLKLHFSVSQTGQITDAALELDINPTPAGTLALGCFGLAVVVTITSELLYGIANGWKAMINDFIGRNECSDGGVKGYSLV